MTTEVYGDYVIEIDEEKPGPWKAHIRRRDARAISTAPYGHDAIPVLSTKVFFNRDGAVGEAKAMIDREHMR